MPTAVCTNCGNKVTFEGIAGVCPNCARVVALPKPPKDSDKKLPPAPRPLSKTPVKVSDIAALGDADPDAHEVFEPAPVRAGEGDAGMDRGVVITMIGAVIVVLVFALFVMFSGPKSPPPAPPTPAPVAQAPAPPPAPTPMPEPV